MIQRRDLLFGLGGAVVGLLAALARPFRSSEPHRNSPPSEIELPAGTSAEDLRREFERMEMRYYTQEGVAVFLACENVADAGANPPGFEPGALNTEIGNQLVEYADILQESGAEPSEADVAHIVELLAERDFYGLPPGGKS